MKHLTLYEKYSSEKTPIETSIKYARGISDENKEIALELLIPRSHVAKSRIFGLELHQDLKKKIKDKNLPDGFDMGIDKDGFFVHTHRARCKSFISPEKIGIKEIKFIDSTG